MSSPQKDIKILDDGVLIYAVVLCVTFLSIICIVSCCVHRDANQGLTLREIVCYFVFNPQQHDRLSSSTSLEERYRRNVELREERIAKRNIEDPVIRKQRIKRYFYRSQCRMVRIR